MHASLLKVALVAWNYGVKKIFHEPLEFCCDSETSLALFTTPVPLLKLLTDNDEVGVPFRAYMRTYQNVLAFDLFVSKLTSLYPGGIMVFIRSKNKGRSTVTSVIVFLIMSVNLRT